MADYNYSGCITGFSASGNIQLIAPTKALHPVVLAANAYTERLQGMGLLVVEANNFCKVQASAWSNPITFEMVNKPASNGGVSVFVDTDYWIDLSTVSTVVEFFDAVNQDIPTYYGYKIGVKPQADGSVLIRFEEYAENGTKEQLPEYIEHVMVFPKRSEGFYFYDTSNIDNNGESTIRLANAFTDVPKFVYCDLPYDDPS